jgi:hypothetical protein
MMVKIRVQETRLKKHKLLEALLKVSVRPVSCLAPQWHACTRTRRLGPIVSAFCFVSYVCWMVL